jgi:mono/diheme cytochrome c family protein
MSEAVQAFLGVWEARQWRRVGMGLGLRHCQECHRDCGISSGLNPLPLPGLLAQ